MPFIDIKTNIDVPHDNQVTIKSKLGEAITAVPGKSEKWLMVEIEPECALWFSGESAPAAMVEVSIYGGASSSVYSAMTEKICNILKNELEIRPDRVYVKYTETENWGWNGSNF